MRRTNQRVVLVALAAFGVAAVAGPASAQSKAGRSADREKDIKLITGIAGLVGGELTSGVTMPAPGLALLVADTATQSRTRSAGSALGQHRPSFAGFLRFRLRHSYDWIEAVDLLGVR